MEMTTLGRTGLSVSRTSFGVLPIQRTEKSEAIRILHRALDGGINFYDTARGYSDSEEKLGAAFSDRRSKVLIATKVSGAKNRADVHRIIDESLKNLQTDYVDLLQLHTPDKGYFPEDPDSIAAGLLEVQKAGKTRFIGFTNHSKVRAREAIKTGIYDTLQFPLSAISDPDDFLLAEECRKENIGFIAMKALCGGLLTDAKMAFAALRPYEHVVPIWGIQHRHELEEILELEKNPPVMDSILEASLEEAKKMLSSGFCRACGYCLPCPAGIPIPMAARMGLLLRRMPPEPFASEHWQQEMAKIEDCTHCNACASRCPYKLDTPTLLQEHYGEWKRWFEGRG